MKLICKLETYCIGKYLFANVAKLFRFKLKLLLVISTLGELNTNKEIKLYIYERLRDTFLITFFEQMDPPVPHANVFLNFIAI